MFVREHFVSLTSSNACLGLIAVIQCLMMGLFVVALQFTADMKLMFENCLDYNGSDSSEYI